MTGYESKKKASQGKLAQPAHEPWCMKMNGCKTKCEDCSDEAALAQQDPVAWAVYCDGFIALPAFDDEQDALKEMQRRNKNWPQNKREVKALYDTTPLQRKPPTIEYQSGYYDGKQAALTEREWNFCERCGKRTADLTVIHTCTPPQENT